MALSETPKSFPVFTYPFSWISFSNSSFVFGLIDFLRLKVEQFDAILLHHIDDENRKVVFQLCILHIFS